MRKIDIYVDGHYVCSTHAATLQDAHAKFANNPVYQGADGPVKIDLTYRHVMVKWSKS